MIETGKEILGKLQGVLDELDEESVKDFLEKLRDSKRIFIHGMGRSGLAGKAFAMRLMHCGKKIFVVGEIVTPAIKEEDALVAISGSGRTSSVVSVAKTAKKNNAKVLLVTSNPDSELAEMSDSVAVLKGRQTVTAEADANYDNRQLEGKYLDLTPMGTLFELSTMVFFDMIIAQLIKHEGIEETDMKNRHTNLE